MSYRPTPPAVAPLETAGRRAAGGVTRRRPEWPTGGGGAIFFELFKLVTRTGARLDTGWTTRAPPADTVSVPLA